MEMIISFFGDILALLLRSLFSDLSTLCAAIRNLGNSWVQAKHKRLNINDNRRKITH